MVVFYAGNFRDAFYPFGHYLLLIYKDINLVYCKTQKMFKNFISPGQKRLKKGIQAKNKFHL